MAYQPLVDSDDEYEVSTSTSQMEALAKVKLRAPSIGDDQREQIATHWGFESVEDAMEAFGYDGEDLLSPPRFWEEAAKVVFPDLTEDDVEEGQIDFAEARRAVANFTQAGNEEAMQLLENLGDFGSFISNQGRRTTDRQDG